MKTCAIRVRGVADSIGTFGSCVMLLEHVGELAAASRLMQTIESITATPSLRARDLGGQPTTGAVTLSVRRRLAAAGH